MLLMCVFSLVLIQCVCVLLPRASSPTPGGAGPVWSDTRGLAGQMEASTSDIFRNIQWGQCNRICCMHKGTKGTRRHFILSTSQLAFAFPCYLYPQCFTAISWRQYNIFSPPGKGVTKA